jgi:hypothetical protein
MSKHSTYRHSTCQYMHGTISQILPALPLQNVSFNSLLGV